jgi:hypothetical protein
MGKLASTSASPALQIQKGLREVLNASSKQSQSMYYISNDSIYLYA